METNIIERAFQIARECGSVEEVKRRLSGEGYSNVHAYLTGKQIRTDLDIRLNPELKLSLERQSRTRKGRGKGEAARADV
jgi:hypothetical protein